MDDSTIPILAKPFILFLSLSNFFALLKAIRHKGRLSRISPSAIPAVIALPAAKNNNNSIPSKLQEKPNIETHLTRSSTLGPKVLSAFLRRFTAIFMAN